MKKICIFIIFCSCLLSGESVSIFNTPLPKKDTPKIKDCFIICEKKLTKVQKLKKALEYYKKSKYYKFSSLESKNLSK
jgi:hypothetical protein